MSGLPRPRAVRAVSAGAGMYCWRALDWLRHGSDDRGPPDRGGPHPGRRLARRGRGRSRGARRFGAGKACRGARGRRRSTAQGRADLRRHDRLRALRLDADSPGAGRGAPAPASPEPRLWGRRAVSARDRAGGDGHAREHAREGLLRYARRGRGAAARLSGPRTSSRKCRAADPSARAATWLRWPTSRFRSSARGVRGSTASCSRAATRWRGRGSSRSASKRRRASRSSTARSSWARSRRSGSCVRGGSPRRRTWRARCRSTRCRPRATASCRASTSSGRSRGRQPPPRTSSLCSTARRSRGTSVVRSGPGRVLASLRGTGPRRRAGPHRARRAHRIGRAQRRDRQPARLSRGRRRALERQLPRPARRLRARRSGARGQRAGEHLGAEDRTARQSRALRWAAGVPRGERRPQLRFHDPAVRRRLARQREQGAQPPRERGLDPDERRPGGSCVDGQRGGTEGVAGARERGARRRDRAARGSSGGRVPRATRAGDRSEGGAGARALGVAAARRRSVAVRRHRGDRGGDPRRFGDRGCRGARRASCNDASQDPDSRSGRSATARSSTPVSRSSSSSSSRSQGAT